MRQLLPKCRIRFKLRQTRSRQLTIVGIEFDTILVRERNRARVVPWTFENLYWVDPGDGFVWQSRQHIARSFPPVAFQILKPPAL